VENIQAGFRRTGIYPLDSCAMDSSMGPTGDVGEVGREDLALEQASEDSQENIPGVSIEKVLLENLHIPSSNTHYRVQGEDSKEEGELQFCSSQDIVLDEEQARSPGSEGGIPRMLTFPNIPICTSRLPSTKPLVDYSKSLLLTLDAYLTQREQLATKCNDTARSREVRKVATEERKRKREENRIWSSKRRRTVMKQRLRRLERELIGLKLLLMAGRMSYKLA
jgi:hypothetical protein